MHASRMLTGLALSVVLLSPTWAQAGSAEAAFSRGQALLASGDLQGALNSYAAAARADRANREYLQQYMLVRQSLEMHKRLEMEKDIRKWEYLARALHSFYVNQGIYSELLALDRKIHARLNTASTAVMLAETQLAMEQNAAAAQTLAGLDADKSTPSCRALLGVALARSGKIDQARQIAETLTLSEGAGPGVTYGAARLHAAAGNSAEALRLLERCFQSVAPSQLDGFKSHARECPEFAALASSGGFASVLKTESKVPESKCSGGSKCAGCPMRGNCSKSGGH